MKVVFYGRHDLTQSRSGSWWLVCGPGPAHVGYRGE